MDRHRAGALLPGRRCASASAPTSRAIRCGARSSPRTCSTAWSTASASTFVHRLTETHRRAAARRWCAPTSPTREVHGPRGAVAADRGARQQGARCGAVRDADRGGPADGARDHVVPALARGWPSRWSRPSSASRRRWRRCASGWRPTPRRRRWPPPGSRPACRRRWRSAWPAPRACTPRSTSPRWPRSRAAQRGRGRPRCMPGWRARLGLGRLRRQIDALPADSHWQSLAKGALADDLAGLQRSITQAVMATRRGRAARHCSPPGKRRNASCARAGAAAAGGTGRQRRPLDLAMLSVALRELRNLA